jgi:hypothetical protein
MKQSSRKKKVAKRRFEPQFPNKIGGDISYQRWPYPFGSVSHIAVTDQLTRFAG